MIPQNFHGTRIFRDLLVRERLLVREGLPRLPEAGGTWSLGSARVSGGEPGRLDAAGLGGNGFCG